MLDLPSPPMRAGGRTGRRQPRISTIPSRGIPTATWHRRNRGSTWPRGDLLRAPRHPSKEEEEIYTHTHTHTHIHTYTHTHIHTYIHTFIHACIRTHIHTCIHTYTYTPKYIHTYTCRVTRAQRGLAFRVESAVLLLDPCRLNVLGLANMCVSNPSIGHPLDPHNAFQH